MTKKYLVFPEGYCPYIANGPPSDYDLVIGCGWTPEETQRCLELEKQAVISEEKPSDGRHYREIRRG